MEIIHSLQQLGLSEKEIKVYLALLVSGACSVRMLAGLSKINRGTVYDVLKSLKEMGLVSYYHKDTRQFFVVEDPAALRKTLGQKMGTLKEFEKNLGEIVPELQSLFNASDKPLVKYYEGFRGVKTVLQDVLQTTAGSGQKSYCVFSSAAIREYLYKAFPDFTRQRIARKIHVKAIGLGHKGSVAKLSEKKSLHAKKSSPTYVLIYPGKVAMVSVNSARRPHALIIEDPALFATQQQLFDFIWQAL